MLWDQELFFEVHEWLEKKWLNSKGTEKIISQALIRSAGTYLHLEHGRNVGARKMASKAVSNLIRHKKLVPLFFNVEDKGKINEGDLYGGTIIREGKALGISTPVTKLIYSEIQNRLIGQPCHEVGPAIPCDLESFCLLLLLRL